jgi:hypothetical protein
MRIIYRLAALCLFLLCSVITIGQTIDATNYQQEYRLQIKKSATALKIDGLLDEPAWQVADTAGNFWLKFPTDDARAKTKTVAKITYDNNFIYIGFIAYDCKSPIGQSLKRDSRIRDNDGVGVMIDPMNKKTNGFYFTATAFNVQGDDLLSGGGDLSFSWDQKWYSATKQYDDYYTVEMAIPFKSLRYNSDISTWGFNFIRSNLKDNEIHTWTRVPVNFPGVDLGYLGAATWDAPPPAPGKNIAFVPYITGGANQSKQNGTGIKGSFNAGFDSKLALSPKLNLDITVNPDFSQIEVDRQVTNLTRFNIFFPERRTFFLENDDLFSNYLYPELRPFYSRSIGLDKNGNTIPIYFGARLTGNLDEKTRIGIMSMQTGAKDGFAAQNYTAISTHRRVLKRSLIKTYFLNRQGFLTPAQKQQNPLDAYGRNAGTEWVYSDNNGKLNGWIGYHHSFKEGIHKDAGLLNFGGAYNSRRFNTVLDVNNVGVNYYADMGFIARIENYDAVRDTVIRVGWKQLFHELNYTVLPKKGLVNQHQYGFETFIIYNPNNSLNERFNRLRYFINFKNTSNIQLRIDNQQTNLLFPISFTGGTPLPAAAYRYTQFNAGYTSDVRKQFAFSSNIRVGQFYNGHLQRYSGSITYRNRPWLTVEMNVEYNRIELPQPYGSTDLFLIAPRIEVNFSTSIFWTTFLQYNTQRNLFNINSRLQWRYKPMSDLFVVYTDNYFTDPLFKSRSRALVFKLNYWLNI